MKKLITSLILLLTMVSLHATAFTYEWINYTVLDETAKTCKTKDGTSTSIDEQTVKTPGNPVSGNLTIPQTVYNDEVAYTVVLIGKLSFATSELTSVVLPQSVTEIGKDAFYRCHELIAINLPSSLKIINNAAFHDCSSLISIDIPASVKDVGSYAFAGCN